MKGNEVEITRHETFPPAPAPCFAMAKHTSGHFRCPSCLCRCVFGVTFLCDVVDLIINLYRQSCFGRLDPRIRLSSELLRNICLVLYLYIVDEDIRSVCRRYFLASLQLIAELDGRIDGVDIGHMVAIKPKSADDLGDQIRPLLAFNGLSTSKQWWGHLDETWDWQYVWNRMFFSVLFTKFHYVLNIKNISWNWLAILHLYPTWSSQQHIYILLTLFSFFVCLHISPLT